MPRLTHFLASAVALISLVVMLTAQAAVECGRSLANVQRSSAPVGEVRGLPHSDPLEAVNSGWFLHYDQRRERGAREGGGRPSPSVGGWHVRRRDRVRLPGLRHQGLLVRLPWRALRRPAVAADGR